MSSVPPQGPARAGWGVVLGVSVVYGLMAGAALLWLSLRDRLDSLPASAGGVVGLWPSLGIGAGLAFVVSGGMGLLVRYTRSFAGLEARLAELLGPLSEREIIVVALASALGEELFFRLAMQDALGLWPTALVFGLLHTGPRGTRLWTAAALVLGVVFGWMVELGSGLLAVTTAHALINYFSLRRMEAR